MVLVRTRGNGNVKEAVEGETFAVVAAVSAEEVEGKKMGSEVVVVEEEERMSYYFWVFGSYEWTRPSERFGLMGRRHLASAPGSWSVASVSPLGTS